MNHVDQVAFQRYILQIKLDGFIAVPVSVYVRVIGNVPLGIRLQEITEFERIVGGEVSIFIPIQVKYGTAFVLIVVKAPQTRRLPSISFLRI